MRKTTLFFSHEYAALEFSLGLKLVFSEAAQWDGQWEWRNTGLPVTCNSALYGRDEHKFYLVFSSAIKSKGLHHVQEDSKWLLLFLLRAWFLFPLKNTFNQHAATQYPEQGEREERKSLANESFMHMAQPHHRSPKELARDPCGHQTAVILSRPFQFKVCETLPPQLQLPMALIHGAKSTHASCSHLRQRDFND